MALIWLARREYSRHELQAKLQAKGYDAATAQSVVEQLTADGYVSDHRFVDSLIRARRARGYGPLRIRFELQQKGIAAPAIESAVDARGGDWLAELKRVRRKKFGNALPATYAERARQARFLQSRGFSAEQIAEVLRMREDD